MSRSARVLPSRSPAVGPCILQPLNQPACVKQSVHRNPVRHVPATTPGRSGDGGGIGQRWARSVRPRRKRVSGRNGRIRRVEPVGPDSMPTLDPASPRWVHRARERGPSGAGHHSVAGGNRRLKKHLQVGPFVTLLVTKLLNFAMEFPSVTWNDAEYAEPG